MTGIVSNLGHIFACSFLMIILMILVHTTGKFQIINVVQCYL